MNDWTDATLRTPRLTLEALTATHAERLFPGLCDESLYAWIPQVPPASIEALRARYLRLERRASPSGDARWLNWALRLESGEYAGTLEATLAPAHTALLAWTVFASHQRLGYAREAAARVCAHLEDAAGVSRFEALIDTRNAPSIALASSLGFERAEVIRGADVFKGAVSDEYRYVRDVEGGP